MSATVTKEGKAEAFTRTTQNRKQIFEVNQAWTIIKLMNQLFIFKYYNNYIIIGFLPYNLTFYL